MKPKTIRITPEMLRACFGPDAAIRKRLGWFRVTTRDGGEVKINDHHINPVRVSRRAWAGCVRLAGEAWGGGTVNGPPDFKLAAMAWAESEGVNMRVAEPGRWARFFVAATILFLGCNIADDGLGVAITGLVALAVWLLMRGAAKRQAQLETDQMSFPFPNAGGDAEEANDEDLKKGGWL